MFMKFIMFTNAFATTRVTALSLGDTLSAFSGRWWWLASVLAGTIPFLISWGLGIGGQAHVSAILLSLMCLACATSARWSRGLLVIGLTFVSHCVLVTFACSVDPQGTQAILPGAHDYWSRQFTWIRTGTDPEYQTSEWLGAHVQLAVVGTLFTVTSLGWLTFLEGFKEVDLMNFYAGQLWALSGDPRAAVVGWHIWSMLRGAGFAILTMTIIVVVVEWLQTRRVRISWGRFGCGAALLVADVVVKFQSMPAVRDVLYGYLR
jgi:hypothetical protein